MYINEHPSHRRSRVVNMVITQRLVSVIGRRRDLDWIEYV